MHLGVQREQHGTAGETESDANTGVIIPYR